MSIYRTDSGPTVILRKKDHDTLNIRVPSDYALGKAHFFVRKDEIKTTNAIYTYADFAVDPADATKALATISLTSTLTNIDVTNYRYFLLIVKSDDTGRKTVAGDLKIEHSPEIPV